MKTSQIAAQLLTVRPLLKSHKETVETLAHIREIGYAAVQVCCFSYEVINEEDLASECHRLGLRICATHECSQKILDRPLEVIRRLDKLDCKHTAYPYPSCINLESELCIQDFLRSLDASARTLADAGKVLCYHNQQIEFRKFEGRTLLERIFSETSIQAELDTYWTQLGGGNPAAWVRRMAGRIPLIHLKDYVIDNQNQVTYTELGNGVLDFPEIIAAADAAGCEWFIVEQDTTPGNPLESLETSYRYLQTLAHD